MRLRQVLVLESGHAVAHRLHRHAGDLPWVLVHGTSPKDCIERLPAGSQAIAVLSIAEQPDSGLELLAWLQVHRPRVRVIVVTPPSVASELAAMCWSLGACLVLAPKSGKDVSRAVQSLIATAESEF